MPLEDEKYRILCRTVDAWQVHGCHPLDGLRWMDWRCVVFFKGVNLPNKNIKGHQVDALTFISYEWPIKLMQSNYRPIWRSSRVLKTSLNYMEQKNDMDDRVKAIKALRQPFWPVNHLTSLHFNRNTKHITNATKWHTQTKTSLILCFR